MYLIKKNRYILGAVMYCGALNHKQMTLYFAPAMFSHLLGLCLKQPAMSQKVSPTRTCTCFFFLNKRREVFIEGVIPTDESPFFADINVPLARSCSYFVIFNNVGPVPVQYFGITAGSQ